ncbi:MAG: hypothetical protein QOG23_2712 [Blastocatellia bacterium]|nr:hypothetical protein [Blastocatellia bacterium]
MPIPIGLCFPNISIGGACPEDREPVCPENFALATPTLDRDLTELRSPNRSQGVMLMSYANGIKGAIALAGTIVVLVGCGHSSKYRASLIALPSQVPESIGSHRFKLTELSDLPSRGDIQFLNEREGWLSNYNRLWHTSNGGRTWEVVYDVSSEIKAGYVRIQFANAETGWRSTIDTLERTADGGKSWEEVSVPFNSNAGTIHSMRFLPDGKRGWLTGGVYRSLKPSQYGEFRHAYLSDGGTKVLQGTVFYRRFRPELATSGA